MTLKGHYALCLKTRASFGAHHENLNEDRLHCQRPRCSGMTLDSDNIRFMRIFAVVLEIYVSAHRKSEKELINDDPQFSRGFHIFCGSQSATPLPTSPLVTPILSLIGSYRVCVTNQRRELDNDYGIPYLSLYMDTGIRKSKENLHKSREPLRISA